MLTHVILMKFQYYNDNSFQDGYRGGRRGDRDTYSTPENDPNHEQFRKLFIGGLNYETTETGLRDHFMVYGDIVDCVVMRDNSSGRSRGFGFITYKDVKGIDDSQADRPHHIEGREVETKRAMPRGVCHVLCYVTITPLTSYCVTRLYILVLLSNVYLHTAQRFSLCTHHILLIFCVCHINQILQDLTHFLDVLLFSMVILYYIYMYECFIAMTIVFCYYKPSVICCANLFLTDILGFTIGCTFCNWFIAGRGTYKLFKVVYFYEQYINLDILLVLASKL